MTLPKVCFIGNPKRRTCFKYVLLQVIDWEKGLVKITEPNELKIGMEFVSAYLPNEVVVQRMRIPAFKLEWSEPPLYLKNSRWFGPPGAMIPREDEDSGLHYLICCPACGELGSAKDGNKWVVTEGDMNDPTTLTLFPSIAKSCCGWHGYLEKGMFVLNRANG